MWFFSLNESRGRRRQRDYKICQKSWESTYKSDGRLNDRISVIYKHTHNFDNFNIIHWSITVSLWDMFAILFFFFQFLNGSQEILCIWRLNRFKTTDVHILSCCTFSLLLSKKSNSWDKRWKNSEQFSWKKAKLPALLDDCFQSMNLLIKFIGQKAFFVPIQQLFVHLHR